YDTLKDNTVTVRERDSMSQERIAVNQLKNWLFERL
ncbi:His/Gly/Thr/Pro-type tRNA ligase C-terminal domain-containing protein, partial [Leptospira interrogans]